jgi:hypothetical protein
MVHPLMPLAITLADDRTESEYDAFLATKAQLDGDHGFDADYLPSSLFDFQRALVEWSVRKGRAAVLADCGLGKSLIEMVWAENVHAETGKPVMILTPLAVAGQFEREAEKFDLDVSRSHRGEIPAPVIVTNYERLHLFDPDVFGGVVCDESSILKSFDGVRKTEITEFMRMIPYRLLGTATAAPNDYTELGTSSEALGYLGHMDMLSRFFTNRRGGTQNYHGKYRIKQDEWRFKGHAETAFWRWVSSWARSLRRPSDLGFSDDGFHLPELTVQEHVVTARKPPPGMLFDVPATNFFEEREERNRTIPERCEMVASLVSDTGQPAVIWCHLNAEGDLLESLIPDAKQVSGANSDDAKEETFAAFSSGDLRVLITKPKIGAWGLNWQHCNHVVYFPSHSYEQYYQAVRRCWRFGQERPVTVDIVETEGEARIQENLSQKAIQADRMFSELVSHMQDAMHVDRSFDFDTPMELPSWISG